MKLNDHLSLMVPRQRSLDFIIDIAKKNEISEVGLTHGRQPMLRHGFSAYAPAIYAVLNGHHVKVERKKWSYEGIEFQNGAQVFKRMAEIGNEFRVKGLNPQVLEYDESFDDFIKEAARLYLKEETMLDRVVPKNLLFD